MPDEAALERVDILAHGARIADDPPRPFQHPLALGREAVEARAAMDQQHAEHILQIFDAGGQGRLGDAAGFGGAAEMTLRAPAQ